MATSAGSRVGNSNIGWMQMKADWTTSTSNTHVKITISFTVQSNQYGSSSGSYPASWSGHWNGSNNIFRSISPGSPSRVVGGTYSIARGAGNSSVTFRAQVGTYQGTPSHSVTISIPAKPKTPPAPTPLTFTDATASSLVYRFSGNGDGGSAITRWEAQIAENSGFTVGAKLVTSGGTTTFTGLKKRTTYYVRSRGVNAMGNGAWSAVRSAATLGEPDAPSLGFGTITSSSIAVTRSDPGYTGGGITGRETQIATNTAFTAGLKTDTGTSPTFTGLARLTEYYFRSRVRNSIGWGPWTGAQSASTIGSPPSAATGYGVSDIASTTAYSTSVGVSDTGGGAITGIRLELQTSAGAAVFSTEHPENGPVLFEGLTPGASYRYRAAAKNDIPGGGWGPYGGWFTFKTRNDVPTAPVLSFTSGTNTSQKLTWTAPSDLLGATLRSYQFRIATNPDFSENLRIITVAANTLTVTIDGLQPGTTYYSQVWTDSSNGPGSFSNVVSRRNGGTAPGFKPNWMRVSGAWKPGIIWMKVSGVWRQAVPWIKQSGVWRTYE